MSRNFIDRFYEEDTKGQLFGFNKRAGIFLGLIFLAIIMVNTTGCTKGGDTVSDIVEQSSVPDATQLGDKGNVKVGNDGLNAAIAPDDVSVVAKQKDELEDSKMIAVSLDGAGRSDPFLPSDEVNAAMKAAKKKLPYDLLPPPESITVDSNAVDVITTKVSGIMYDTYNPSAILNISGSDYLVRTGDIINNYKVLSITKDTVTVQLGSNVYKAGVGQIITEKGVNYNVVSNLESKFGGTRNKVNKK